MLGAAEVATVLSCCFRGILLQPEFLVDRASDWCIFVDKVAVEIPLLRDLAAKSRTCGQPVARIGSDEGFLARRLGDLGADHDGDGMLASE